ncbi:AraC family transcriptional regulator [Aliiglaciecola sp. M165]|uniref:AraC family transcriptional regulator n=1 Tax=Aliiglaciecola sp. M165 TaxID=2593649 RepID=UPI00117C8E91|nr:AraC family transcriptional regulator [Aliiglaciecola sp. M165]TRY33189.1 helix-turn-helix domain-containing protein [Aliiglaciecola sp. M165]
MTKHDSIVISTQCRERFLDQHQLPIFSHWCIFLAGLSELHHQYIISKQKMGYHVVLATLEGSGILSLPGKPKQVMQQGDMLLLPADCEFRYELNEKKYWQTAWLMLEPTKTWQHFPSTATLNKDTKWNQSFARVLQELNIESVESTCDKDEMVKLLCEQLYLLVGRQIHSQPGNKKVATQRLKQLVNEIEMSPSKPWSLDDMCRYSHYSRAQLTRLFNQHFAQSPSRKVIHIKMHYAALMLRTTSLPIKQIAHMVGIDNAYNFSSRFKQSMALAPSVYRLKNADRAPSRHLA